MEFGLKKYLTYERRGIKNVKSQGSRGEGVDPYFLAWHGCALELTVPLVISKESHKTGSSNTLSWKKEGLMGPQLS